jgi:alkanesulfonate monooxygenase SsuD/methylene tetrahydromethanopterin reductase-like flavin-dependent oxidoreductase (luciferase family)
VRGSRPRGLFRSDHYLSVSNHRDLGSLDAWTTIAALAARTERLRLGTLVSPVTFRHPSLLAKAVVTADHVSGGRVELGMGAGWHVEEHRAYGFPYPSDPERMAMLEEQVEIVHRSWKEEGFDFTGRHYRLEGAPALPKPLQEPHPPLINGGRGGARSLRLAARWADEYDSLFISPQACRRLRDRLEQARRREGRDDVAFSLMLRWMDGPPDKVAARLREYGEAGVDRVMLQQLRHEDVESVAMEVLPALSG